MKRMIIVGPYRVARRYAERRWLDDEYLIITRAHQLAHLDPSLIGVIIVIEINALGRRIVTEINDEVRRICALWPVPLMAAPA